MSKERRLIDANALELATYHIAQESEYARGWNDALYAAMINAPTIDAVEVVRCKDCLHQTERYGHMECIHGVSYRNTWNKPDFFCAYGERKEGVDNEP